MFKNSCRWDGCSFKVFVFTSYKDLRDVYKQYETTADSISGKLAKTVSDNPAQSSLMLQIKSDIESWNNRVGSKRFENEAKVVTTEVETSSRRSRKSKLVKRQQLKLRQIKKLQRTLIMNMFT